MIKHLFGPPLHQHPDPGQRLLGVAALPPDSEALAGLLATDPAAEVRAAAASRCTDPVALAAAWGREADATVRAALVAALGPALAASQDGETAASLLDSDACPDAIRLDVARRTQDAGLRHRAIAALRDEDALVDLALVAEHAETRMAAAKRVQTLAGLRKLADAAKDRDRGVAKLARTRIESITTQASQATEADALLAQLESLATTPGPILTAVVDLDRRWQALDLAHDPARIARAEAARQVLLARFDRERDEERTRAQFARRLTALLATDGPPATAADLAALRSELALLRDQAATCGDPTAVAKLDAAEQRCDAWAQQVQARADAEALVAEAEQLAAGTSIDDANLPERWLALAQALRTPALTRRLDAALALVEQRRLASVSAAEQAGGAARQDVHRLLHAAEQALAAGQVQAAHAAADAIRIRKVDAGRLPKPTAQRLGRLTQQLADLERWESFGQRHARIQLCERAEALPSEVTDAPQLAAAVGKLRAEWKALDQAHAGVPKAVWERFDRACEKAYAPAARHFAQLAAQRKDARRQRDAFIAATAAEAAARLQEPRDWRAIEQWLRDADRTWRTGDLGSVEHKAWSAYEARYQAAVAPLRDALAVARADARTARQALIDEASALAGKATDHDAPSRVKALQAQWQAQAKAFTLPQRDERVLWEQFRAACNAVFDARQAKRKQEDDARHEGHRALEAICLELEQLAAATARDDAEVRRGLRELDDRWRKCRTGHDPAARRIEARFREGKAAVEAAVSARAREREASVWQTLAAKERLCEELDALVQVGTMPVDDAAATAMLARWAALPALAPVREKRMLARRDGALRALADPGAAADYAARIATGHAPRAEMLLGLEIALGLDSPAELQPQRLALQVKQLRQRFQSAASTGTTADDLLAWCAEPGVTDARDRQRCEKVFAALGKKS